MTKTMTHTVTRTIEELRGDSTRSETITVRILKKYIEDSCGNKFALRNGSNLTYSSSVCDRIDLSTLTPIAA